MAGGLCCRWLCRSAFQNLSCLNSAWCYFQLIWVRAHLKPAYQRQVAAQYAEADEKELHCESKVLGEGRRGRLVQGKLQMRQ